MKQIKILFALTLALCLLCGVCTVAYAHEVPDLTRTGSITVEMIYNGKPVSGGTLTAYRVGQIVNDDENYSFGKTDAMAGFTGNYDDMGSADLARDVAAYVRRHNISDSAAARNVNGKAVFSDLELGLYLVVQTENSSGYETLNPFLIALPMNEDGHYVYQVNAEGKFELTKKPDKPWEPTLPQTGQLNWPVPLLTVLGLCLFSAGWVLYAGGRKERHET